MPKNKMVLIGGAGLCELTVSDVLSQFGMPIYGRGRWYTQSYSRRTQYSDAGRSNIGDVFDPICAC